MIKQNRAEHGCSSRNKGRGQWLASNPGFPFWILSPKLRDKIRNGKPGFEASQWLPLHIDTPYSRSPLTVCIYWLIIVVSKQATTSRVKGLAIISS